MDFFKIKKFGKGRKSPRGKGEVVESEDDANAGNVAPEEEQKDGNTPEAVEAGGGGNGAVGEGGEDDDDDFITNEVKRRLKEMRNNSFMVLIPEEECAEVEEDVKRRRKGVALGNGWSRMSLMGSRCVGSIRCMKSTARGCWRLIR
jgi:hypothetical protein